jgi:hypothetical protein
VDVNLMFVSLFCIIFYLMVTQIFIHDNL